MSKDNFIARALDALCRRRWAAYVAASSPLCYTGQKQYNAYHRAFMLRARVLAVIGRGSFL